MKNLMKRGDKGVSMLEVLIASVILVTVVAMVYVILMNATTQVANDSTVMAMQEKARQLLETMTEELHMADGGTGATGLQLLNQASTATLSTTMTTVNGVKTPYDPLGVSSTDLIAAGISTGKWPDASPFWNIPLKPTSGYKRIYEFQMNTLRTATAGKEVRNGVLQSGDISLKSTFDFTNKKPSYPHRVIYKMQWEPVAMVLVPTGTTREDDTSHPVPNGIDDNKNTLIDERILTKQEYDTDPTPGTLPGEKRVAFNLRNICWEIPSTGTINRVIIHVLFQGVDSKGKLVHYYTQTAVAVRN